MLPSDTPIQPNAATISQSGTPKERKERDATALTPLLTPPGYLRLAAVRFPEREGCISRIPARETKGTSVRLTAINLINSFVGAGLMALPHAFAGLGLYAGLFVIISVTIVMYHGMTTIAKCAGESEHSSLSRIVKGRLGSAMGRATQICILCNNFGVLILYMVVIGDTLVGTQKDGFDGLLPNLTGDHSGQAWYLSRWFVTLMICVLCVQPLVLKRRLGALAGTSIVSVALVSLLALFSVILAILTIVDRDIDAPIMVPNQEVKEQDININCSLNLVIQGISIYVFAFIAHYNIPPLMEEMENSSERGMTSALRQAVGFSAAVYTIVPISCWIVFGTVTNDDILKNLGAHSLSHFMPEMASQLVSYVVSVGYTVILLCIFPMDNWALRQNLSALCFSTTRPAGWRFYSVTYSLLFGIYVSALSIGSVFVIVSFVGCTACSFMGLILPGLLTRQENPKHMSIVWAMILCGVLLIFHGTVGEGWRLIAGRPIYCQV